MDTDILSRIHFISMVGCRISRLTNNFVKEYCTYISQIGLTLHTETVWVCMKLDEEPASLADGDIYIVSRLQGVDLCLLSKSISLEREHHQWPSHRVSNTEHRH